jgi:hypothetical protein
MVNSSSTYEEVRAEFEDSANYDLLPSIDAAKLHINAGRILISRMLKQQESGENRVEEEYQRIEEQLGRAISWWESQDPAAATATDQGAVIYAGFKDGGR